MSQTRWRISILILVLLTLACQFTSHFAPVAESKTPTETASSQPLIPTETLTPTLEQPATLTPTPTENPTAAGPCQIVAAGDAVIAYTRPSLQADSFGQVAGAGFPIPVQAQTADGWLGFDPGVAQAANTGVFRNRWVLADQVQVEGACDAVPVVVGPPPGVCFTMPMDVTPVYTNPDKTSTVIISLAVDQYAAVLGRTNDGWAKVDLSQGNSGNPQIGWVAQDTLNFNGPCDALPVLTP